MYCPECGDYLYEDEYGYYCGYCGWEENMPKKRTIEEKKVLMENLREKIRKQFDGLPDKEAYGLMMMIMDEPLKCMMIDPVAVTQTIQNCCALALGEYAIEREMRNVKSSSEA